MADADVLAVRSEGWASWSATGEKMRIGDTYTIAGVYERRTFWQWLWRAPRQLHIFTLIQTYREGT
jgi:hypothetical protein